MDTVIGYLASTLTIISLLPQLVKIILYKSAKDVSLESYFLFILVEILWLYYGVKRRECLLCDDININYHPRIHLQ
jgi:MtN3 and saliva related transmembrane protein